MAGGVHRSAFTRTYFSGLTFRNVLRKWHQHQGSFVFLLISQKTHIAKSAYEPKLQRLLAEDALAKLYLEQKSLGDSITADHKVLNEEGQSRNNHRYAVVFRDLATQWIQSCPCKTKTSQVTEKSLRKFFEPSHNPKVIETDNSLKFVNFCDDQSWNHRTSTPHRSEANSIAERAVRRVKEGTSAVLLQSGLDEKWWADSMECYCLLSAKCPRPLGRWENSL